MSFDFEKVRRYFALKCCSSKFGIFFSNLGGIDKVLEAQICAPKNKPNVRFGRICIINTYFSHTLNDRFLHGHHDGCVVVSIFDF